MRALFIIFTTKQSFNLRFFNSTVCTPMGFVRLFGVIGQVLVKPHLLRDVNDECQAFNLEEAAVKRKLAATTNNIIDLKFEFTPAKLCAGLNEIYQRKLTIKNGNNNSTELIEKTEESEILIERLKELEAERKKLDKLRDSSGFQRNFVYPIAMLLLLLLTGITVLLVVQNTLELLIGIKALPQSTRVSFFFF